MPALIKESEITWADPVRIRFGFAGITAEYAINIMRNIMQKEWPQIQRPSQCVYIIRLTGEVAVAYDKKYSPVIYIGEGNAYDRLYDHIKWLASLVVSVPQVGIEVRIAQVRRRNHDTLYQYIEADLLCWFCEAYGTLPWFNRQRERSKEAQYDYEHAAKQSLTRHLGVGSGNSYLWAIRPTPINDQYAPYNKGAGVDE
jgi:hypothetical protein